MLCRRLETSKNWVWILFGSGITHSGDNWGAFFFCCWWKANIIFCYNAIPYFLNMSAWTLMCIYCKIPWFAAICITLGHVDFVVAVSNRLYGCAWLQVDDIVRAAKRACYRAVPMAAAAWLVDKPFCFPSLGFRSLAREHVVFIRCRQIGRTPDSKRANFVDLPWCDLFR